MQKKIFNNATEKGRIWGEKSTTVQQYHLNAPMAKAPKKETPMRKADASIRRSNMPISQPVDVTNRSCTPCRYKSTNTFPAPQSNGHKKPKFTPSIAHSTSENSDIRHNPISSSKSRGTSKAPAISRSKTPARSHKKPSSSAISTVTSSTAQGSNSFCSKPSIPSGCKVTPPRRSQTAQSCTTYPKGVSSIREINTPLQQRLLFENKMRVAAAAYHQKEQQVSFKCHNSISELSAAECSKEATLEVAALVSMQKSLCVDLIQKECDLKATIEVQQAALDLKHAEVDKLKFEWEVSRFDGFSYATDLHSKSFINQQRQVLNSKIICADRVLRNISIG
eukprot:Platyproteum_vivax@DN1206_c0_g1_i1.p1